MEPTEAVIADAVPSDHVVRRVDWRFLLPDPRPRHVVAITDADDARSLTEAWHRLGVEAEPDRGQDGHVDVVLVRDPTAAAMRRALELRVGDGAIVVETTSRRARLVAAVLLRRARLSFVHYGSWPSVAAPTRFVPLGDRAALLTAALAAKNPRRRAVGSTLARLGLGSWLFRESTTVVTVRGREQRPAPLRIAFGDGAAPGGGMTLLTPRFGSSRHVIAMCGDGAGRHAVVKTPRSPGDDDQLAREADGLASVTGGRPRRPELLADTERFGQRWLVQSRLDGLPLTRHHVADDPGRWRAAARDWLDQMPTSGRSAPGEDGRLDRLVRPARAVLVASADREPALRRFVDDADLAVERLRAEPLPVVAEHGDFRPPNLLVDEAGALGAVDWELAERRGFPLHDLAFFHAFVSEVLPKLRDELMLEQADVARSLGIEPALADALRSLSNLRQLANLIERGTVAAGPSTVAESDVARAWSAELDDRAGAHTNESREVAP